LKHGVLGSWRGGRWTKK